MKRTYPKTVAAFKRQAESGFRRANRDAGDVTFEWMTGEFDKPRRITYPTGLKGFTGSALVTADGYGTVKMLANADQETGLSVRSVQINLSAMMGGAALARYGRKAA